MVDEVCDCCEGREGASVVPPLFSTADHATNNVVNLLATYHFTTSSVLARGIILL